MGSLSCPAVAPPQCTLSCAPGRPLGARQPLLTTPSVSSNLPGARQQRRQQQRLLIQQLRCPLPPAAAETAGGGEPLGREVVEADTIIDPDGTVRMQPQTDKDQRDLWRRAIKLPMYSVGWAPILVRPGGGSGSGAAALAWNRRWHCWAGAELVT